MGAHSAPTNSSFRRIAISSVIVGGATLSGAGIASAQPVQIDVPNEIEGFSGSLNAASPEATYSDVAGFDLSGIAGKIADQLTQSTDAPTGVGQAVLDAAETKIGSPYVWGATGPDAFDCSGLTSWAYKQAGVDIPRTSQQQAAAGTPVDINDLQIGDLVTFYAGATHVGIYAGNGQVLNAPTEGVPVSYAPIDSMPIYNAVRF